MQLIAEKVKIVVKICTTSNLENASEGDDEGEKQSLLQIQDDERRAAQRFECDIFFFFDNFKGHSDLERL